MVVNSSAFAISIVSPNGLETTPGNEHNCIPTTGCLNAARYQQVFNQAEFSLLPGPMRVTQVAFSRAEGQFTGANAFSHAFSHVQIGLSTTGVTAGALSSAFAANRGSDFTIVSNGALTVSSASSGFGTVQPFDVIIQFATTFIYDPALGNLLFEWQNFGGEEFSGGRLDSHGAADGSSRILSTSGDPLAQTASSNNTSALVTQFTFAPVAVAEPTSLALAGIGLTGLFARRRQRSQSSTV